MGRVPLALDTESFVASGGLGFWVEGTQAQVQRLGAGL